QAVPLAQALHEDLALPLALLQDLLHQAPALALVHPAPGTDFLAAAQATFAQTVAVQAAQPDARAGNGSQVWGNAHVTGSCRAGNDCAGTKPAQQHGRRWPPRIT